MLAVIRALEDWPPFPGRAHHKVENLDGHKNLEYFMTAEETQPAPGSVVPLPVQIQLLHASPTRTLYGQVRRSIRRADHGTGAGTTAMSHCSARSSSQLTRSELSPDCHWKGKSAISFGRFARETARASRRTQSRGLQRNSGGPRESRSEHQSGQSTTDSSVSRTESTCLMIRSYAAASHPSTMTPE